MALFQERVRRRVALFQVFQPYIYIFYRLVYDRWVYIYVCNVML